MRNLISLLAVSGACVLLAPNLARSAYISYGKASYYGHRDGFAGRRTANGEIFNPNDLTAASRTFPFNTKILVTSLDTHRSVIVRINDWGPRSRSRILDLSYAAARVLGIERRGVAQVSVQPVDKLDILETVPETHMSHEYSHKKHQHHAKLHHTHHKL